MKKRATFTWLLLTLALAPIWIRPLRTPLGLQQRKHVESVIPR
jgi:hypothetical protein